MSRAGIALLPDRGVIAVTGEDARKLLQGIVTNDVDRLDREPAMLAGLLSPQGKVLFDFFVVATSGGFLLDVARDKAVDLAKRLVMYRLRAKAAIEDVSAKHVLAAAWGGDVHTPPDAVAFVDPRDLRLGRRVIWRNGTADPAGLATMMDGQSATPGDYHAHRIALGIPEGGRDYDFGDAFPHEANFDLVGGVSFEKGCYVGQEIVARMEHRGTVRKRVVRIDAAGALPSTRADVKVGDVVIGRLGSVAGHAGLAVLRLDRAIEAIDKGVAVMVDGIAVTVDPAMIARQRALLAEKAAAGSAASPEL